MSARGRRRSSSGLFSGGGGGGDLHEREYLMDKQASQQLHRDLQRHDSAYNQQGKLRTEYLETLTEHGIDESTALLMRNMLSKDYVLANYTRAEVREAVWLARIELLKIKSLHPRKGALLQAEYRQFMFDDELEGLSYLDDKEETLLAQALLDIFARITRGDDGFQQDQFGKTISESIVHDDKDKRGGGFFTG